MITTGAELLAAIHGGMELPPVMPQSELTVDTPLSLGQIISISTLASTAAILEANILNRIPLEMYPPPEPPYAGELTSHATVAKSLINVLTPSGGMLRNDANNLVVVVPFENTLHDTIRGTDAEGKPVPRTVAGLGVLLIANVSLPSTRNPRRFGRVIRVASYRGVSPLPAYPGFRYTGLISRSVSSKETAMAMVGNLEARGTLKELALVGLTRMYAEPKPLIVRPERKIAPEKPSASS